MFHIIGFLNIHMLTSYQATVVTTQWNSSYTIHDGKNSCLLLAEI